MDIDLDRVIMYEESRPNWSLMDTLKSMDRVRFSDLDLLAKLIGFEGGLREAVDSGFTIQDIAAVIQGSRYLGFTDSDSTRSPSEEQPA